MANMTFKASLLPNTNLGYSLGSETQNWKIYGAINSNATLDGSSFAIALQTYFNNNKTNIARNSLLTYYSSAYGNGTQLFGYFLNGYNDSPYGGFFAAHYNTPKYIGIQGGTFTEQTILTNTNYSTTLDGRYVTLSTEQTITAKKTFKETIIAYKYGVANNLPFITFDKPGSHYAGIGPDGTSNRIHFGPCDLQGTAWVASSTFNSNEWHFQGAITGTSTATISGGIISNHGHNLVVAGNEVNFIPDGYNSTLWFNYDSFNRTNNSTITRYLMGNGSHGHAELQASKVYGAVWNDYAEMRNVDNSIEPGRCVHEVGNGEMVLSTERLERGCKVISDTYGFNIGETEKCKTPIAVSGRVLVYLYEGREYAKSHIGWPVCSGPNGTVSVMSEEEEIRYPSRIIGTISEIPEYETWGTGNVQVNDRIWIYVR